MINFIKKLFFKIKYRNSDPIQPMPKGWKLTISDLIKEMDDGKRKSIGYPELDWAIQYERSLIPSKYRFPQKGDLYESKVDQIISFLTSWKAPFTGDGKSKLFKGERIWIALDPIDDKPIGVYALPVEYSKLEQRMVSESDRIDCSLLARNSLKAALTTTDVKSRE